MPGIALVSVSDKTALDELGRALERLGWTVLSTGGTAAVLREAGCKVTEVADFTGFPEILDGRVKTLHPKIFGGILAAPTEDHRDQLARHHIPELDLVVVNLYPFRQTASREGVTLAEVVEQIDIGGPSLLRAAAKNHARVAVVVDPADYAVVLGELAHGQTSDATRWRLAVKAFRHTAAYDAAISATLPRFDEAGRGSAAAAVAAALLTAEEEVLRYGENPHQVGVVARTLPPRGLAGARQIQGKALSYNNLGDATGGVAPGLGPARPGVAIVKHANPCGVGLDDSMAAALRKARATDPVSAFGGVIAANRAVTPEFAEAVVEEFAEVVIAPGYLDGAEEIFGRKKNLRVLEAGAPDPTELVVRNIDGGFLLQDADHGWDGEAREVATKRAPDVAQRRALELAWRVVKHVSSNAIVVGGQDRTLGIGAGQMSRVDAAKIAVAKAREIGLDLAGSVAASDAFFPFPDGIEALHQAGVEAIIQPGGSIRDREVIEACDRLGVAMLMTQRRHFRH